MSTQVRVVSSFGVTNAPSARTYLYDVCTHAVSACLPSASSALCYEPLSVVCRRRRLLRRPCEAHQSMRLTWLAIGPHKESRAGGEPARGVAEDVIRGSKAAIIIPALTVDDSPGEKRRRKKKSHAPTPLMVVPSSQYKYCHLSHPVCGGIVPVRVRGAVDTFRLPPWMQPRMTTCTSACASEEATSTNK